MNDILLAKRLLKIREEQCKTCGCPGCGKNPLKDLLEWYGSDKYGWKSFINLLLKDGKCIYKEKNTPKYKGKTKDRF